MSRCGGWRIRSYATNGRSAPTKDVASPAVKAGWSRHPKTVVVVLEKRGYQKVPSPDGFLHPDYLKVLIRDS